MNILKFEYTRSDWFTSNSFSPYWRGTYLCRDESCKCSFSAEQLQLSTRGQPMHIYVRSNGEECTHECLSLKPIRCDKFKRKELGPKLNSDGVEKTFAENYLENLRNTFSTG